MWSSRTNLARPRAMPLPFWERLNCSVIFILMLSIGLDVGTAFVKCISGSARVIFPSLYAYRTLERWESGRGIVVSVGEYALKMLEYPSAVVIRPVIEGRPVHHQGFLALVKEAVHRVCSSRRMVDAIRGDYDLSDARIVVGLPYSAGSDRTALTSLIHKALKPRSSLAVPQAAGTLVSANKRSATVMSIGQGTTEIVAFEDMKPVSGVSLMQASDYITSELGEFSYLDPSIVNEHMGEVERRAKMLADILSNRLASFMSSLNPTQECSKLLLVSGGGLLIPGVKGSLAERVKMQVEFAEDPVMANAIGLHILAGL